jgi:hypothetical protein
MAVTGSVRRASGTRYQPPAAAKLYVVVPCWTSPTPPVGNPERASHEIATDPAVVFLLRRAHKLHVTLRDRRRRDAVQRLGVDAVVGAGHPRGVGDNGRGGGQPRTKRRRVTAVQRVGEHDRLPQARGRVLDLDVAFCRHRPTWVDGPHQLPRGARRGQGGSEEHLVDVEGRGTGRVRRVDDAELQPRQRRHRVRDLEPGAGVPGGRGGLAADLGQVSERCRVRLERVQPR